MTAADKRIVVDYFNRKRHRDPRKLVLQAVKIARDKGWPMTFGEDAAIELDGARWCLFSTGAPGHEAYAPLSIVGVVLLAYKVRPKRVNGEDEAPDESCARFLGIADSSWTSGIRDGWRFAVMGSGLAYSESETQASADTYYAGYEIGAEARFAASSPCQHCGVRRFKLAVCGSCGK